MYNTKINCTYHTPEVFLNTDEVSETDKKFIRDVIYRQELLDIFGIEEYIDTEINKSIYELYAKIKDCIRLKECMVNLSKKFMSLDEKIGLIILFSYDYLYLTHRCVCEFLGKGTISSENIELLKSNIFKTL
jgi:hypothetical protein